MKIIKKNISFLICFFALLIFYLQNIDRLKLPAILLDEIGYWSSAAYWNGYNWSSLMGNFSSYYSYGYSVILYILMRMFKNAEILHQAAIIVNIFMILFGYCILREIIKKFFPSINFIALNIGCMVPLFYPSVQYHTQTAWSETLLFFLFLVSVILAIKVFETDKCIYSIMYTINIVYMYVVHQRCIGIVIIGISYILLTKAILKKKPKELVIFFIVLIICLFGCKQVKSIIKEEVYTDKAICISGENVEDNQTVKTDGNDFSGQVEKIKYIFTIEGFKNLLISIFGKLYYFILASFLLGGNGLFFLGKSIWKKFKSRDQMDVQTIVAIYILGSFFSTLGVASIFMIYPGRIDTVAYGRYTDWIGILIVTFGFFNLVSTSNKEKRRVILGEVIFVLLFLFVFNIYIEKNRLSGFFASCSPIMTYFNQKNQELLVFGMTLVTMFIGVLIYMVSMVKKINMKCLFIAILSIYMWIIITFPAIDELIRIQHGKYIYPIVEYVNNLQDKEVVYLYDETSNGRDNCYLGSIQYLLQDNSIRCTTNIQSIDQDNSVIIVSSTYSVPSEYLIKEQTDFYKIISREK